MFTARPDLIKRIIYLAGITVVLAIIRFSAMNFEFPTFNMEENPIANDPSFLVRVSVIPNLFRVATSIRHSFVWLFFYSP